MNDGLTDATTIGGTPAERRERGARVYREVMAVPFEGPLTAYGSTGVLEFVFGDIWARSGLDRRNRRWIALACSAEAGIPEPIESHVFGALASGDISYEELLEFVLHFAVYCGWPRASQAERIIHEQFELIRRAEGKDAAPGLPKPTWGEDLAPEQRIRNGEASFIGINCVPGAPQHTPYSRAGIVHFVFGEVWQRPGLSMRDRRFITLACVGCDDSQIPVRSHVYSALRSGDVSIEEMREVVLQFATVAGWPKASFLDQVVGESVERIQGEEASART